MEADKLWKCRLAEVTKARHWWTHPSASAARGSVPNTVCCPSSVRRIYQYPHFIVDANSTYIYFVSRPIPPPTDALATAFTFLDLSTFLSAIFSTSLAEVLKTTPRTTLLIPDNSAFKRLGMLVSAYFLLPSAKADLEKVILHHTLDGVEYAESLHNGSQRTFASLEGSDITLQRHAINDSMLITASGGWTGMRSELVTKNILTQSGVIHELTDILIPRSVDLTIGKLLKAAKVTTMTTLVNKAGLDWVLNGTAPPEDSPWADLGAVGWTFLCPTDDAFKGHQCHRADEGRRSSSKRCRPTSHSHAE